MNKNSTFLHFLFNENGNTISSFNSIPLSNRIDTSRIKYHYDSKGNCIERIEEKDLFEFRYLFFYKNNELSKEVKLDEKRSTNDTLYIRYIKTIKNNAHKIVAVNNDNHKEFMSYNYFYDKEDNLIKEVTKFTRNQNRIKKNYYYDKKAIVEKTYAKNYGRKKFEKWEISYLNKNPDLITIYKNGDISKKIRFNYSKNGKLTALIERDFKNESIRLIEISYYYFNN